MPPRIPQVRLFSHPRLDGLEEQINAWLLSMPGIEVVQITALEVPQPVNGSSRLCLLYLMPEGWKPDPQTQTPAKARQRSRRLPDRRLTDLMVSEGAHEVEEG